MSNGWIEGGKRCSHHLRLVSNQRSAANSSSQILKQLVR